MPRHNVRVELYYRNDVLGVDRYQWVPQLDPDDSACSAVYSRDPISMAPGRTPQQAEPVSASGSLTFKGHTHNPRNPSSALYGRLQENNNPIRIMVGDDPALTTDFVYSATDTWAGGELTWTNLGGAAADFDVNGSEATHTHPSTNVSHASYVDTGSPDHLVRATWDWSAADLTGAGAAVSVRGRATDADNFYAVNASYDTSEQVTVTLVKRVGGLATVLDTWSGTINLFNLATADMCAELYVEGNRLYGKVWRRLADFEEPLAWQVSAVDNSLTTGNLAGVGSLRATGSTNANLQARFHDFTAVPGTIRYAGEIKRLQPQRTMGGDTWVAAELHDVLGRLEKAEPLRSALWREIQGSAPLAHWPFNDGADSPYAASALPGGSPMSISATNWDTFAAEAVDWEPVSNVDWLEPMATPAPGLRLTAIGEVPMSLSATSWSVDFSFRVGPDSDPTEGGVAYQVTGTGVPNSDAGPRIDWQLIFESGTYTLLHRTQTVTPGVVFVSTGPLTVATGAIVHARLKTEQVGADVEWELLVNNTVIDSGTLVGEDWNPIASLGGVFGANDANGFSGTVAISHFAVWDHLNPPSNAANAAVVGRAGELVADRLARLCLEEGIPFELIGESADTDAMGPQLIDTLAANFAACEVVDMGYLHGSRHQDGLTYRTRVDIYAVNQTPVTLDVAAGGEVGDPLDPEIGDLGLANDVTATRPNGSSARSVQETGPLNVQAPPNGVGRYAPPDLDAHVDSDAQLQPIVDWRRFKGTQNKIRYPKVTVDFDALVRDGKTALARSVSHLRIGDRLDIDNLEPEGVRQITPGYTETVGPGDTRRISFNAEPAAIYDVGVYNDGASKYDSAYSTTGAQITTGTSTSLSVAVEAGRSLWVTGSGSPQFPIDIDLLGARVRVTAISGASSPQTFTISTTVVNGINKVIPAGTQVRLWSPVRYGL